MTGVIFSGATSEDAPPRSRAGRTGRAGRAGSSPRPSLRTERSLQRRGYHVLAGMDEVGRGALAGPVSVGVVLIDETCRSAPVGVRDSKLLSPQRRKALVAPVRRWALAWGVGHAGADEIDEIGLMTALRLAGVRALEQVRLRSGGMPDLVILDGNHDWLTDPARVGLFGLDDGVGVGVGGVGGCPVQPPVRTLVKADRSCSSVAAASILAKVERDEMLIEFAREHPVYQWDVNKGYAAPEHVAALAEHGPCVMHRRSWQLPGATPGSARASAGEPWREEVAFAMGHDGDSDVVEVTWT